ncbi:hypothetical protein BDQ17DRAFT_1346474 [Cyathus striatus]|nr:hypothetical protein BDQ17DRAFT_1346474 [Cyathus striatus]
MLFVAIYRIVLRTSHQLLLVLASTVLLCSANTVIPHTNNPNIPDFNWPTGLLLLAFILYFGLGLDPEALWSVDPSIGLLMGAGLPTFSIPAMRRVSWVAKACHFVPNIRFSSGRANFWVPSDAISASARLEAFDRTLNVLSPIVYESAEFQVDENIWKINKHGLLEPIYSVRSSFTYSPDASPYDPRLWEVRVRWKGEIAFSTNGTDAKSLFDVQSESAALPIVAAKLVRRPHSQSSLRAAALNEGDHKNGPYTLMLDSLSVTDPASSIDFHSYSADSSKVAASLTEFARAYYRVIQYIKQSSAPLGRGLIAHVQVGQTLWIAILGGVTLDRGRLTIQNLPGRWAVRNISSDEAYISRISAILELIRTYARKTSFFDLVYSGGSSRRPSMIFLVAGILIQAALCFVLSISTSAGVWTSVSLANVIMLNKLTDWHSMYWGKTAGTDQPGMKMYVPGRTELLAIATFDRTSPREGAFAPGTLLNVTGMLASTLGVVFQDILRSLLGLPRWQPPTVGIFYAALSLAFGTTVFIVVIVCIQQKRERTWNDDSEFPLRCMVYSTLCCSLSVTLLSWIFVKWQLFRLWPLLEIVVWLSGIPFGILENGRMIMLFSRWISGSMNIS